MQQFIVLVGLFLFSLSSTAQSTMVSMSPQARELYSTGKDYIRNGDLANGVMVLNQAVSVDPDNLFLRRELGNAYYLIGDLTKAEKTIMPLLKDKEADEETYVVAANILSDMKRLDDAKDVIDKGINKYTNSGMLYNTKGQVLNRQKKYKSASEAWEKGIEKDPTYHINYYNLSKVYFFTKKYWWAILYAETFINMESFSSRSEELKKILFESYKFLIADLNNNALQKNPKTWDNPKNFEESSYQILNQLKTVVTGGINNESLTMLRLRFLLEWNKSYAAVFPLELFDHLQRLLLNGHFIAYSQWLYAKHDNEKLYKQWTQKFANEMNSFDTYVRNHKLQPKSQQYYQTN